MDVILLEKVQNLGKLGQRVAVRNGYARNYLIPNGKAVMATTENLAAFETRRQELEKVEAEHLAKAQARRDQLTGQVITITAKVGEEGKLFGSVGTADIADAAAVAGIALERHELRLPEGSFRQIGEYQVEVHLHPDVDAAIAVHIVGEE